MSRALLLVCGLLAASTAEAAPRFITFTYPALSAGPDSCGMGTEPAGIKHERVWIMSAERSRLHFNTWIPLIRRSFARQGMMDGRPARYLIPSYLVAPGDSFGVMLAFGDSAADYAGINWQRDCSLPGKPRDLVKYWRAAP